MSDLISRVTLLKALRKEKRECEKDGEEFGGESILYAEAFEDVIDMVKRFPTVDAVPVVRCAECIHCSRTKSRLGFGWCGRFGNLMRDDGFCSMGEKRN